MGTAIVFASEGQRKLLELIERIARSDAEILITGPSGVGKELYATHAHRHSRRASRPFVAVNCANLSPEMMESEIFGHARGAFTGAAVPTEGIAAAADGGTLFLDEVDSLPTACQAKLLRFAELKEYRRLGENFTRRADVRLIAASNANLENMVRNGTFRQDLYYRLRVAPVQVSPLAARREDIPVLLEHFVERHAREMDAAPITLSPRTEACMMAYHWPGNVRELQNCVRYLTCLQLERPIEPEDLPAMEETPRRLTDEALLAAPPMLAEPDARVAGDGSAEAAMAELSEQPMNAAKETLVAAFERDYLDRTLSKTNGNVAEAARRSGKNRRTIFQLLRKYNLPADDYRHME